MIVRKFNENNTQLEMGIKVESEHCNIYDRIDSYLESFNIAMPMSRTEFYEEIAKAHIKEIPDYYTRLLKMEKE